MRKHLVLAGGGHAHMVTLENIDRFVAKGYKVTVIAPSFHHYYSGMGPGMLGGTYAPDQIRFATRRLVELKGGIFVKDYVTRIDPVKKQVFTRSGNHFNYDVLSVNAGSRVPDHGLFADGEMPENAYAVKPIEKLMEARDRLKALAVRKQKAVVSVVGGGPSSAEVAGNVWQLSRKLKVGSPFLIRIFAGRKFMGEFHDDVRVRVRRILTRRGIDIVETGYVKSVEADRITLASGAPYPTDFTFTALGVRPTDIFEPSGIPTGPDGGMRVNRYLASTVYPDIFGGGDCIYFEDQPLDKVGVYAVRENPVLFHNLMARLDGTPLVSFEPGEPYLLIFNLGGGQGVLRKKALLFGGRPAFWVKDFIDTRFMKKFQAAEKGNAPSSFSLRARNH